TGRPSLRRKPKRKSSRLSRRVNLPRSMWTFTVPTEVFPVGQAMVACGRPLPDTLNQRTHFGPYEILSSVGAGGLVDRDSRQSVAAAGDPANRDLGRCPQVALAEAAANQASLAQPPQGRPSFLVVSR